MQNPNSNRSRDSSFHGLGFSRNSKGCARNLYKIRDGAHASAVAKGAQGDGEPSHDLLLLGRVVFVDSLVSLVVFTARDNGPATRAPQR